MLVPNEKLKAAIERRKVASPPIEAIPKKRNSKRRSKEEKKKRKEVHEALVAEQIRLKNIRIAQRRKAHRDRRVEHLKIWRERVDSFFGKEDRGECVHTLVNVLHDGLIRRGLLARRPNFTKWHWDFKKAIYQGLVSIEDIEVTLVWYVNNLEKPFMPQAYSPSGFLEKYPAIRKRFLEATFHLLRPEPNVRMKEEQTPNSVGLTPPPELQYDLLDWYDRLVEDGESFPGEIERYAAECESRSTINR